jgi:SAM-dependent methyltransferase
MNSPNYHLEELAIARDPRAPRHIVPTNVPEGGRVLDIGCGAGQTLIALDRGSQSTAVGIDVDVAALLLGQTLTDEVRFACARAEALPFSHDSFDFVIARLALPYADISRAVTEIERVLRGEGMCWLVLHPVSHAVRQLLWHLRRLELKGAIYQLYVIANGVGLHLFGRQFRFPLRRNRIESFQTSRGIHRALRGAGLVDVMIRRGRFFVVMARKPSPGSAVTTRARSSEANPVMARGAERTTVGGADPS